MCGDVVVMWCSCAVACRYRFKTFDDDGEWGEYVVLPGKLRQLAETSGLKPVDAGMCNFGVLAELLQKQDGKGKEVWNQMSPAERELVQLYTTFVFAKE